MASSTTRYGTAVILTLVFLRLAVGWHFFKEGAKKLNDPASFTSRHFLGAAKGPWADYFTANIPDRWGKERLDEERTIARFAAYKDLVVAKLRLNESQRKQADKLLKNYEGYAETFFAERAVELNDYFEKVEWVGKIKESAGKVDVPYNASRVASKQAELTGDYAKWTGELDRFQKSFVSDLQQIAEGSGDTKRAVNMPQFPDVSKSWLDPVVSYTVFGVGVLLVLGLFTRFASLVGAAFLASVVATQPPWVAGAEPTYYQIVELIALLLLCVTAAGRFAGLDYFINALWGRCCSTKSREER